MTDDFKDDDLIIKPGDKLIKYVPGRIKVNHTFKPHRGILPATVVLACLIHHFHKTHQTDKLARVEHIASRFRTDGWNPEKPEHEV